MTYDELKTKIRDYTEVDSNVFTDTILNGFIEDAEFRLLREVDSDNNRFYATALLTVDQRYVQTPNDLLVVRSAQIVDSTGVGAGTERDFLDYRDTNFMAEYNKSDATGVPKYYSYWDESHLVFAPVPNATYSIQLNYILKPQGLSSTNATTYLSEKFPNGLLYACLVEAYGFLKGPLDMLQHYDKKYVEAVKGFSIEQMGRRRRDEYQSGVPRIGKQ